MSDGAGRLTDAGNCPAFVFGAMTRVSDPFELASSVLAIDASLNPPTTNYTLPGVLFFLQSSWRKAERERTSWEMERAELKVLFDAFRDFRPG
jgi:hypothetical protein